MSVTDDEVEEKGIEVQRHGTMYLLSSTGITAIGFLATIFYAHWVGAAILGAYFIFLSLFNILGLFTDLGISSATTIRMCQSKERDQFFTANLTIRLTLYLFICIIAILIKDQFPDLNSNGMFWFLLIALGISTTSSSISVAIAVSNRLGLAATVSLLNNFTRILFQVSAIFLGFEVFGLIGGLIAGLLVELLIQVRYIDYHIRRFTFSQIKQVFSFSSWAFLSTTATVLFDNVNPLIIALFLPTADVGIYGVCWTFSVFALFVSTALCNTLYVKVSHWNATGKKDLIQRSLTRATTYSLILSLPMLAGGIILGEQLLYYLYGASFSAGYLALVIIIFARIFQSIFQLYTYYLMATDHIQMAFIGLGLGIMLNILLSFILIPILGLTGAALAALANVLVCITISRHFIGCIISIIIEKQSLINIIVATVIMTAAIILIGVLPISGSALITVVTVIVGTIVYLAALLILDQQIRDDARRTLKIQWIPK